MPGKGFRHRQKAMTGDVFPTFSHTSYARTPAIPACNQQLTFYGKSANKLLNNFLYVTITGK